MTESVIKGNNDELSIKDIILRVKGWTLELIRRWKIIVLAGLLGGCIGLGASFIISPKYTAELSFVLEENSSNPLSTYSGLASQFGIDLGMNSNSGVFQGDNIMEFLKSRLMIEKTLLSQIQMTNGKPMTMADYYIQVKQLREKWESKPEIKDIHYPLNYKRTEFTRQQDSILKTIYEVILKKDLKISKPDKKLSFLSVEYTSTDELFAKVFTETLVDNAIDFYIETKTQRTKANLDRLQLQADSMLVLLNNKTYLVASSQDINQNPARRMASISSELAMRDKSVLQTMYGEVVKNLEISKIAMAQETPIIQIVDTPILPLEKNKLGKLKGIVIGGFIAGVLIVLYLFSKIIYREIIS